MNKFLIRLPAWASFIVTNIINDTVQLQTSKVEETSALSNVKIFASVIQIYVA